MGSKTRRIRKQRNPERELALVIGLPEVQLRRGFKIVDAQSRTDADHRHAMRSKQVRTLRKLTRTEKLYRAGVIDMEQANACEWFMNAHTLGYDTVGITANYGGARCGGHTGHTHMARNRAQMAARDDYQFARSGISPLLLPLLEGVLLRGRPVGRLGISFRTAVRQLTERVRGQLQVAA